MELVQIIYKILLFGSALLITVVAISYLLSKSKKGNIQNSVNTTPIAVIEKRVPLVLSQEQTLNKNAAALQGVNIFQMDPRVNKELKILRKPTVNDKLKQINFETDIRPAKRTNGKGKRYTIVNEEMKKTFKPNVINF